MPDILDAAQKQINDAANQLTPPAAAGSAPPSLSDPNPPVPPPQPDPASATQPPSPMPPAPPPPPPLPVEIPTPFGTKDGPPPASPEPTLEESEFVDKLIHETSNVTAPVSDKTVEPTPPPPPPPIQPKNKRSGKGAMIAAILLLLFALPMGVLFVSQQQKQLADTRSQAAETCISAFECSDNGNSCSSCTGFTYKALGRKCCTTTGPTPTPTPRPPTPTPSGCHGLKPTCPSNQVICDGGAWECAPEPTAAPNPTPVPCLAHGYTCVPSREECRDGGGREVSYACQQPGVGLCCDFSGGTNTPTPTSGGTGHIALCGNTNSANRGANQPITAKIKITDDEVTTCNKACRGANCAVEFQKFHCDQIGLSGGCQQNGVIVGAQCGSELGFNTSQTCGTQQIDIECRDSRGYYKYSPLRFMSYTGTVACAGAPTPTPPPGGPTPTPRSAGPQCTRIKIYKDGTVISDPSTLASGDTVTLAVVGTNATRGRFRVNGGTFTESTGTNTNGEFTLAFTIPSNAPNNSITVEAEVFQNGVWQ